MGEELVLVRRTHHDFAPLLANLPWRIAVLCLCPGEAERFRSRAKAANLVSNDTHVVTTSSDLFSRDLAHVTLSQRPNPGARSLPG
jgi:hypothetical protein